MQSELTLIIRLLSQFQLRKETVSFFQSEIIFSTNLIFYIKTYKALCKGESQLDLFVASYAVLTENESQTLVFIKFPVELITSTGDYST